MDARPLAVVSDFDGTIVEQDIGDELCKAHCPEAYAAFDRDWRGGRLTLLEGQRRIWPELKLSSAAFDAAVDALLRFRDGFERFHAALVARRIPFVIASNGFEQYIARALVRLPGKGASGVHAIYANRLRWDASAIAPEFPLVPRFGCGACGVCKGNVLDALRAEGYRTAFVGDGGSDRCAAGRADAIFAVEGATFARHLASGGHAFIPFTSFETVGRVLGVL